jgi:hypothetical protein
LRSTQALVFDFKVGRENNRSWYLQALSGVTTFPGYRGRIWVNKSNLQLMRLERKATEIEADFPIQQVETVIDYSDVALADGTNFVLPVQAVNITCPTMSSADCWRNQLIFKHWQKFAARARVFTAEEEPPAQLTATPSLQPIVKALPPEEVSVPLSIDLRQDASAAAVILNDKIAEIEKRPPPAAFHFARVGPAVFHLVCSSRRALKI